MKALLFALLFVGCGTTKPPHPIVVIDPAGATCATACENIARLGCVDKRSRCVVACENVQASGVFSYDVGCISNAMTCARVDDCMQLDPGAAP